MSAKRLTTALLTAAALSAPAAQGAEAAQTSADHRALCKRVRAALCQSRCAADYVRLCPRYGGDVVARPLLKR